jgi:phosphatidylserine decarboxylase
MTGTLLFSESMPMVIALTIVGAGIYNSYKSKRVIYIYLFLILLLIYFYRFPNRKPDKKAGSIVSPSDGKIMDIIKNPDSTTTICIFLSPLDVHIQWIPYNGTIVDKVYKPGKFHPAYMLEKSKYNESNVVTLQTDYGYIEIKQIAGLVARRIVCWVDKSDVVKKGKPYGMIKLSSRVDITLPMSAHINVKKGDKVKGCETVVGTF